MLGIVLKLLKFTLLKKRYISSVSPSHVLLEIMTPKLSIVFNEDIQTFDYVDFCDHYGKSFYQLFCASLTPPLMWQDEEVRYIRFVNLVFDKGVLTFDIPSRISFEVKFDVKLTMIIPGKAS